MENMVEMGSPTREENNTQDITISQKKIGIFLVFLGIFFLLCMFRIVPVLTPEVALVIFASSIVCALFNQYEKKRE